MEKTDKELIQYGIKMIKRGGGYRSILNYLKKHRYTEEEVYKIIQKIKIEEKNFNIKKNKTQKNHINGILGLTFILGGISLTIYLWDKGYLSIISIGVIGIGLLALANGKKDITNRMKF